ncbi:MAG: hypothetical protein JRL30_24540 [Deltaproteobacteria bacterium]|nr:hypothetical protein [Deltaproteobacteria bacterium]
MYRICLCVFLMLASPVFYGCGMFDFLKGDADEQTQAKVGKPPVQDELNRLRAENTDLKKRVALLKRETKASLEESLKEMKGVESERDTLNKELAQLREENKRIAMENRQFKQKLQEVEKKGSRDLKIKVLSGDGDLRSAKDMTKKLMGMDYKVGLIGYAPRSNFKKNTVYFKPKFEKDGKLLVSELGDNAVIKPLTWPSVFDLIVVTGKTP